MRLRCQTGTTDSFLSANSHHAALHLIHWLNFVSGGASQLQFAQHAIRVVVLQAHLRCSLFCHPWAPSTVPWEGRRNQVFRMNILNIHELLIDAMYERTSRTPFPSGGGYRQEIKVCFRTNRQVILYPIVTRPLWNCLQTNRLKKAMRHAQHCRNICLFVCLWDVTEGNSGIK